MKYFCRVPAVLALSATLLAGCATVEGPPDPEDPFERFNRAMYTFNDTVDRTVVKPVAQGYNTVMPTPLNKAVSNFFSNLDDVVVIFNDLLQFKLPQAAQDSARVFFNSTIGLLGFIDVASGMELPKHNEDFGQTLGYWGVASGPYIVWPFFGPSNPRDTVGLVADAYVNPLYDIEPDSDRYWLTALNIVDTRAGLLSAGKVLEEAALDPYLFVRDAYQQRREHLIHDGHPPRLEFDE
ncbi:MAG: VacJ family lipoprotein [Granulosicoccaceae bacterium]|jgi:phospholipid-binding lipoprotein MlaA